LGKRILGGYLTLAGANIMKEFESLPAHLSLRVIASI